MKGKKVIYSSHIERRIVMRKIDRELPQKIYEQAEERFIDTKTGHTIAVMKGLLYGK